MITGMVIALGACAKGAEQSSSNTSAPQAPTLNLSASLKQLHFAWAAVDHATHYKLLQNPDGRSGYQQVGSNLTTTSTTVDIAVHQYDWPNAKYIVEACNTVGCTDSAAIDVASAMVQTIGYAKASNPGLMDRFGRALALSGDGNTLAVGAWFEASAATGINGNQLDDSAPEAGAVYVFVRNGSSWAQQAYIKASNPGAGDHFGTCL